MTPKASGASLDVLVLDQFGHVARGLSATDFHVEENGKEQRVTTFAQLAGPSLYTLVLDDLAVSPLRSPAVRALAVEFIEKHTAADDLVRLATTSARADMSVPFTTDKQRVVRAIGKFEGGYGPQGDRGLNALSELHDLTASAGFRGRRKALVFISTGLSSGLYLPPSRITGLATVFELPRERTSARVDIRDVIAAAAGNNVAIYTIDPIGRPGDPAPDVQASSYRLPFGDYVGGHDNAAILSRETGGLALTDSNEFDQMFEQIAEAESSYYVLGYNSTNGTNDGKFRKVIVRTTDPELSVRTRTGYVAK